MCGIVGLFLKNKALEPQLGQMLQGMLGTMCERGPDSAGFAIYGVESQGRTKITVQSPDAERDFASLKASLENKEFGDVKMRVNDTHAVLSLPTEKLDA